jgi:hypothetical protein
LKEKTPHHFPESLEASTENRIDVIKFTLLQFSVQRVRMSEFGSLQKTE